MEGKSGGIERMRSVEKVFLKTGDQIEIGTEKYSIENVTRASDLGEEFDLELSKDVPIYWLSDVGTHQKGAYVPSENIVLFFTNTDRETQHHELTHVVEFFKEKSPELEALYEKVKSVITDQSFEGEFTTYNFKKNIHEFIADGRTKPPFIEALKKEGLYEEFQKESAYLFTKA
jgi:hypothetical protein